MTRSASPRATSCVLSACALALLGCAQPRAARAPRAPEPEGNSAAAVEPGRATTAGKTVLAVRVLSVQDDTPAGGDGAPRMTLAFELADGTRVAIPEQATAYAAFRDGVALVDRERRLLLATADGARRVLAREAGAPPARGPAGELAYVARYGLVAEVHLLGIDGRDHIVASGLADAGALAPQRDGSLLFVGARAGGVAGLWRASVQAPARCLTNCALETGSAWGDRFVPLPRDAASLRLYANRVEWTASDGTQRSAALAGPAIEGEPDQEVGEGALAPARVSP